MKVLKIISAILIVAMLAGCAAFRTDIRDAYQNEPQENLGARSVSVLFIFSHYDQTTGWDAIPKLENKHQIVRDYDDFFIDALPELSNIDRYATFTNYPSDVADIERRARQDSLKKVFDYTIDVRFDQQKSFSNQVFGTIVSTISATVIPVPYTRKYSAEVMVRDNTGLTVGEYERSASLTNWVEMFLIFAYPFHPEKRKEEEIYISILHDVFRQIESEKVLK